MNYTQCTFKKVNNNKVFTQCWIDTKHAKVGKHMQLIDLGDDFWEVTSIGATTNEDPSLKYRTWNNNI